MQDIESIINKLDVNEIRKNLLDKGCHILEQFYSQEYCNEIIKFIDSYKEPKDTEINYGGSELRIWRSQNKNPSLAKFAKAWDAVISKILNQKLNTNNLLAIRNKTLDQVKNKSAKLEKGRWHLDSFFKQYKIFLFLTETHDNSGAFEFIPGSHKKSFKLANALKGNYFKVSDFINKKRTYQSLDENFISKLNNNGIHSKKLICPAGTVMLVDTSAVHRASPCRQGHRYALTAYY